MADTKSELTFPRRVFPRGLFDFGDRERWFPESFFAPMAEDLMRVDEFHTDGEMVVRAEIPGVDPDKDVEIQVIDGSLQIRAEKRKETKLEKGNVYRSEIHYGAFSRILPLPPGTTEKDLKATYRDGVLEVHIPMRKGAGTGAKRIPISRR